MPQSQIMSPLSPPTPLGSVHLSGASPLYTWSISLIGSLVALLAPALWNGHAIVFYDTGGYVEAALAMHLVPGRSLFYGLFLWISSLGWWSLWGPILVQSFATLWLLHLLLRCHHLPAGPLAVALCSFGLSALTGISWYTAQLMPDILVPLAVIALWLLGFQWSPLGWGERIGLTCLTLLALLSHMSCLALALGCLALTLGGRWLCRSWPIHITIWPPTIVIVAAVVLMPLLHLALTGTGGYTPGGPTFLFGRLVQDGIAQRWLAEHCPTPGIALCAHRDRMPFTADDFLWGLHSPFQDIGSWKGGTEPELKQLTRAAVIAYPGMTLWTTLRSTGDQMVKVATGDALEEDHIDTRGILSNFLPHLAQSFNTARQQQHQITQAFFDRLNLVHRPVALLATLTLLPIALWCQRTGRSDLAALALFVFFALLGNAFICGALSNPHDRYQSRLVWLAPLVVGMALSSMLTKPDLRVCHLKH